MPESPHPLRVRPLKPQKHWNNTTPSKQIYLFPLPLIDLLSQLAAAHVGCRVPVIPLDPLPFSLTFPPLMTMRACASLVALVARVFSILSLGFLRQNTALHRGR